MMDRSRTRLLTAAAAALALSGLLGACGSSDDEATATSGTQAAASGAHPEWAKYTFTIADNGGDGTQALATASKAFDGAPYKVKFARFDSGPPLVQAAASGQIDLGWVGNVPPITTAAKTLGFRVVGATRSLTPDEPLENIIVPKDSPIRTIADLKGKRISVPQGSSAHGLVLNALAAAGLTTKDVKLVFLQPADAQSAFQSGKVDAWGIWNPLSALAVKQGARVLVKGLPPYDQTSSYYVASKASLDDPDKRAALTDALKRLGQEFSWGNAHPDDFAKAVAQETGLSESDARSLLPVFERRLTALDAQDAKLEQQLADRFLAAGEIPEKVDFSQVVDELLPQGYEAR